MLFVACSADRAPSSNAGSTASSADASSSTPETTAIAEPTCAVVGGIAKIVIHSDVLSLPIRVSIVSPNTGDPPDAVLYLFHGAETDESQWEAIGIQAALNDVVATGRSRPFTVVLPDIPSTGDSAIDAGAFFNDVMPAVERCLGGPVVPRHRIVGGISRGGSVALEVVAEHADSFAGVGGHSPAVADVDQASLVQRLASNHVRVWLDVGTEDPLLAATRQFSAALTDAGDAPELRLAPGGHDRAYWGGHLHDYLDWYGPAISS
jgi:enterochelin esterase-like enzyme